MTSERKIRTLKTAACILCLFVILFMAVAPPGIRAEENIDEKIYLGDNACIFITEYGSDEGLLPSAYTFADIYVDDASDFKTYDAFDPEDGLGKQAEVLEMAKKTGAVFASNSDYYKAQEKPTVIRNGKVLKDDVGKLDLCVIEKDGTMMTYDNDELRENPELLETIKANAWQAWSFGPVLLNEDGSRIEQFDYDAIAKLLLAHPRTALGYFDRNHYCIVTVAGRQDGMPGVTLEELSAFFEEIGCKKAYNLDGGGSSHMVFEGEEVGHPCEARILSDMIYVEKSANHGELAWSIECGASNAKLRAVN